MTTRILNVDANGFDDEQLKPAAEAILAGEIVAVPSETVYGLASRMDPTSAAKLRSLKGRAEAQPFSIAVPTLAIAQQIGRFDKIAAMRLADRFWPGPLTLIVPSLEDRDETVGIRIPAHKVLLRLLEMVGEPIVLTSANVAGEPAATDPKQVAEAFAEKISVIVDSGPATLGEPSALVKFDGPRTVVVRDGIIDRTMILRTAARHVLLVCTGNTCRSPMAEILFRKAWANFLKIEMDQLLEYGCLTSSAGVAAAPRVLATPEAVDAMRERSLDLTTHRSSPLLLEIAQSADHIYTMTRGHLRAVLSLVPSAENKCELLDPAGQDIPDPIGGDLNVYRRCAAKLEISVRKRVAEVESLRT